ncbi:MAG: MFS transporter [Myxococcota bacterium]
MDPGTRGPRAWLGALRRPAIDTLGLASFRHERAADATLPVCYALMEGGFVGVIADKVYDAHPAWIALATAAPMFGNLSSVLWARLAERVRVVPLLLALQAALVLCVGGVALLPGTKLGGALLMALLVAARISIGAVVTVRSVVWTRNYPRAVRARITSRLTILAQGVMAATAALAGAVLDRQESALPWLYAAGAVVGLVGVWAYTGVRLREEKAVAPAEAVRARPPKLSSWQVLREDPLYARYLGWQFLLGISNMMVEPAVVYAVSREMGAGYGTSVALIVVVPMLLGMGTLPLWAGWVDRMHAAEFRSKHSWLWVISQSLMGAGILLGSVFWVGAGRVVFGVARGGGGLAWQLGHNDFARPERAGLYMGIHATLTGLRGSFAPFLGMLLYLGAEARALPGGLALPAVPALGGWLMVLAATLSLTATLGFTHLRRTVERERSLRR